MLDSLMCSLFRRQRTRCSHLHRQFRIGAQFFDDHADSFALMARCAYQHSRGSHPNDHKGFGPEPVAVVNQGEPIGRGITGHGASLAGYGAEPYQPFRGRTSERPVARVFSFHGLNYGPTFRRPREHWAPNSARPRRSSLDSEEGGSYVSLDLPIKTGRDMPLPAILERLRLPVIAAPMFIVSNPDLVIAQMRAGIVGSFPALNARPASQLDEWLHRITEETRGGVPFAVNLIVHKTNARLDEDLKTLAKWKVPLVITSLGANTEVNAAIHNWGGIVLHDVIDNSFARKAIEKGADGLIAVAAGAGGHAGRQSPFALMQEIRAWFDGPVALSGAIACGRSILAAQAMGADFAYIGTPWIATSEANAAAAYKQAIVESSAADIVYSSLFTGVHGNYLRPSIAAAGLDPDNLPQGDKSQMDFGSGGTSDAKAWRDIWGAGQGVGAIKAIEPVATRVETLLAQYQAAKRELLGRIDAR